MMWVRLIGSVFILGSGIVSARSENESIGGMEACFRAARVSDANCSKLPDDPVLRLDCIQKTRSAQLECVEHVLSGTPAEPATPKTPGEATQSEPAANAVLPQDFSERVSPPTQTGTLATPAGIPSAEESKSAAPNTVRTIPPGQRLDS